LVARTAEEVEDLFEMRANFEGLAAYRAAERATAAEISLLSALAAEAREPSPGDPEALERVVLENLRFHIEVMRMSRIPQMPNMARMVLPNALHRLIAWSQRADDAEESFRMHQKIASAIGDRSASMARLLMREDIYLFARKRARRDRGLGESMRPGMRQRLSGLRRHLNWTAGSTGRGHVKPEPMAGSFRSACPRAISSKPDSARLEGLHVIAALVRQVCPVGLQLLHHA